MTDYFTRGHEQAAETAGYAKPKVDREAVPAERRNNSETDLWYPTNDPMTPAEIAEGNGFYGWQKFRPAGVAEQ